MQPQRLIAAGESQSAFALVTYYNGVQPLTHAFDGFFVHSRGAVGLPLVAPGKYADIAGAISGTPTIFRTDQTRAGDRHPDRDRRRRASSTRTRRASPTTTASACGRSPARRTPTRTSLGREREDIHCGVPINNGDHAHRGQGRATARSTTWLDDGHGAGHRAAHRRDAGRAPTIKRNADGIALGGIRTPPVDVPVATLSGAPGPIASTICLLLGSTQAVHRGAARAALPVARRVPAAVHDADADATIKAGFALADDRAALLGFAQPDRLSP